MTMTIYFYVFYCFVENGLVELINYFSFPPHRDDLSDFQAKKCHLHKIKLKELKSQKD